jgi:hypothetical protein
MRSLFKCLFFIQRCHGGIAVAIGCRCFNDFNHAATLPSACGIGKRAATRLLFHKNRLQGRHPLSMIRPMTKLVEIQTAILQLEPTEREALRHWLDETEEETPEMLAAIDQGLRSLKEKGVIPLEDVRKQIPQWATKSA